MPVMTPVAEPALATAVLLLLHVPPVTALLNVMADPAQIEAGPDIDDGDWFTVTTVVTKPPEAVYVIVTVPVDTPVTIPVPLPAVAIVLSLLLHTPPVVASLNVMFAPAHTVVGPVIAAVPVTTEIVYVATAVPQLLVTVYNMVSIPADTPVTNPPLVTVAVPLLALHTPPVAASVSVADVPIVTVDTPDIVPAFGIGLTVTACVAVAVPQPLVTA
jgi:hypothetical protein